MTEYARLQVIRLSNYKLEVENTEKLNNDIVSAFAEINTELEKDDGLVANDLFDVDRCIEELKKTRKRWASGGSLSVTRDGRRDVVYTKLPALKFEPSIYILSTQVNGAKNILNMTINIDEGFKFRFVSAYNHSSVISRGVINMNNRWTSQTQYEDDWSVVKNDAYNTENIVLTFNDYRNPPQVSKVSVDKWIAFE